MPTCRIKFRSHSAILFIPDIPLPVLVLLLYSIHHRRAEVSPTCITKRPQQSLFDVIDGYQNISAHLIPFLLERASSLQTSSFQDFKVRTPGLSLSVLRCICAVWTNKTPRGELYRIRNLAPSLDGIKTLTFLTKVGRAVIGHIRSRYA